MAQIASIFLSTANSSPSSQAAQSYQPDSVESDFPTMLSQASFSANAASGTSMSSAPASDGANGVNADSATNAFSGKVQSLLKNGVSLDRISNAIASKLVALADGKSGSSDKATAARVAAVAAYLKQGEPGAQDAKTTANDIAQKVVVLLSALRQQNASSGANGAASIIDSGKILDALPAGDTPTTQAPIHSTAQTGTQAAPATGTLLSALAALLPLSRQGMAFPSASSSNSSLTQSAESLTAKGSDLSTSSTPSNAIDATASAMQAGSAPSTIGAQASAGSNTAESTGGAQATGPSVDSGLEAIAAGEGTALERALIRAAGASVARESTLATSQSDASLAAISASLDQLFEEATAQGGAGPNTLRTPGGMGGAGGVAADSVLGSIPLGAQVGAFGLAGGVAQRSAGTSSTSGPASAQSPSPLDEIMDQVVSGLSMKNFHDNPTVSIALNPPDLGRLNVKISVVDSNVTASVVAPSSEVQNALLAHRAQLDQLFASAGLKLGSLNVDVSGEGLNEEAANQQTQRENILAAPARATSPLEKTAAAHFANLNLLNQLV